MKLHDDLQGVCKYGNQTVCQQVNSQSVKSPTGQFVDMVSVQISSAWPDLPGTD